MWDPSVISGPVQIPIFGPEQSDEDGGTYEPITGYQSGYFLVVASYLVDDSLVEFASVPSDRIPIFSGQECKLLSFSDESEALSQASLSSLWYI